MGLVVANVQDRLQTMLADYDAELVTATHWPRVIGYAPWVEEVWVNYLSNALKYGGRPPHVMLGSDVLLNGFVRFWVQDNGMGLSSDEKAQLFTQFTRLHQVRTEGHGLGLSIVQRIVLKLGGEVGLESIVGEGSTFWFTLPAG